MCSEIVPMDGMVKRHNKLRIGVYRQHLMDQLDPTVSPLDYMMQQFPEVKEKEEMRRIIGMFFVFLFFVFSFFS
jgi:ATP-binding cassette, subfamily F, member 2